MQNSHQGRSPRGRRPPQKGRSPRRVRSTQKPRPVICRLDGDHLVFDERVSHVAGLDAIRCLSEARRHGLTGITLDFSRATAAYPDGMLQVVTQVDFLRHQGMRFDLIVPDDRRLAGVFDATNWAHIINPAMYDPSTYRGDAQLPIRRFATAAEQQEVVNEAVEVALHQMAVDRQYLAGLEWALNEITDNVLNHADAAHGGLVQVATFPSEGRIQFAVGDHGRGIFASMKEGHPELRSDIEAIGEALKQGVTRDPEIGQGNGLAGALRVATQSGGTFSVASGSGEIRVFERHPGAGHVQETERRGGPRQFVGTFVFLEIRTDGPLDLESALDFGKGGGASYDYVDYLLGDGDAFDIKVAGEAVGFGSRDSGRALRRKLSNLLRADPAARVQLDWAGVPLVSSSFADELMGRLFVELGPLQFAARVQSVNVETLNRELVDRAILQRAGQAR